MMPEGFLVTALDWARQTWDLIGRNAANIIALSAVAFAAYQAMLMREHNRLSVRPRLLTHRRTQTNYNPASFFFEFELQNNGLGPAVVDSWKVLLDGESQELTSEKDADKLIRMIVPNPMSLTTRFLGPREVIRASDSLTILSLKLPLMNNAEFAAFEKQLERLALVIEYSSMYGEKLGPLDTRE